MREPCENYRVSLEAYVDGELPDNQTHGLARHIVECERCAAYRADLVLLRDGLGKLTLARDVPNLADTVVHRVRRGIWMRFAVVASTAVLLKLLDVLGVFGGGAIPRLIVAAGVLSAFCLLRTNPLRIVRPEEILRFNKSIKGADYARG